VKCWKAARNVTHRYVEWSHKVIKETSTKQSLQ